MNPVESVARRADRFQQRHGPAAFAFAVVKKFGDDRGGSLAALITYYGFLALFPLLLVAFTVVAYLLPGNPKLSGRIAGSVLRQFPVIGPQIEQSIVTNVHPLHGSLFALVVGVVGLLWGSLGVAQILQFAMQQVWNVPGRDRPNFIVRVVRSLLLFAVLGGGVVATTAVASLGTALNWGPLGSLLAALPALVVNFGLFFLVFRVTTPGHVPGRDLLPGVAFAAGGWQVLQTVGVNLVSHQLRHTEQVYGTFAFILGLLSVLYLTAQLVVYAAEINVVRTRRLWPRSLVQPPLTGPDRQALVDLARQEERRPEQGVEVDFTRGEADPDSAGRSDSERIGVYRR